MHIDAIYICIYMQYIFMYMHYTTTIYSPSPREGTKQVLPTPQRAPAHKDTTPSLSPSHSGWPQAGLAQAARATKVYSKPI